MANSNSEDVVKFARALSERDECDVFFYNGAIQRKADLEFIYCVHTHLSHKACKLILLTDGGDADAAYKISRYLQDRYSRFEVIISGLCKSAGTLIAMGANQIAFTQYGELGPLDVQIMKQDHLTAFHSGLNISEALESLEKRSVETYLDIIGHIIGGSGGMVSFQTASKAATDVVAALYAPIFRQIDPEDVGSRARSMRIAADYGKRLNAAGKNMKPRAVDTLAETYSSHSFVIDKMEAKLLFNNVRDADELELNLIQALGEAARWSVPTGNNGPLVQCLSAMVEERTNDDGAHPEQASDAARPDGGNREPDREPDRKPDGGDRADSGGASGPSRSDSNSPKHSNGGRSSTPDI